MSRGSGFTEAELMAAEWSRKNKKSEVLTSSRTEPYRNNDRKGRLDSNSNRRDRRSRDYKNTSCSHRNSSRSRRSDSRDRDRNIRNNERRRSRSRSRTNDNYISNHYNDNSSGKKETTTDMFGRTIEAGRVLAKPRSDSRSRSRSPDRHARSRMNDTWGHDKFNRNERYIHTYLYMITIY